MDETARAIAIVGLGAILPDAPDVPTFWENIRQGRYSISEVPRDRWDPDLYYDPDPAAPEKTYSKIGGWVRQFEWNPLKWRLPIPPRVAEAMDDGQKWAVACTRQALADYGYPERTIDPERTAVILGNAMAGEKHYWTALRIFFPELARALGEAPSFESLPAEVRKTILGEAHDALLGRLPGINEDTMPGELANCIAGRVANLFNFNGPNFVVDAACASAMAAIGAAVEGLVEREFDAAITGGIDRNMGVNSYVKFCKIGALSATGTRPYADGADGFVMGEGAAVFLLKRLADAERDGDRVYAVLRGVGGSSDGRGKGITAPNPVGQKLAIQRAWRNAGLSPSIAGMIEGHGTSTRVGDVVEVQSLIEALGGSGVAPGSIALGSVKSNLGHLKAAAGAAGLLKAVLSLHDAVLPPSLHFDRPNPSIDFAHSPLAVNVDLRPWPAPGGEAVRTAGVSAFGFGGTNFHLVLEEFVPGRLANGSRSTRAETTRLAAPDAAPTSAPATDATPTGASAMGSAAPRAPLRGALVLGAQTQQEIAARLAEVRREAEAGRAPGFHPPAESDLRAPERLAIDYGSAAELAEKAAKAEKAIAANNPAMWKVLRPQGVFRGSGSAAKVAFLYTGQGSQYVNMLAGLRAVEPAVARTFEEADRVMTPFLGRSLTSHVFVDTSDASAVTRAEEDLRQTAITQPVVLTVDTALTRLLAEYGVVPDMVMGHSLGEYAALVAAGALPFAHALEAVCARGKEMTRFSVEDNGWMAAVFAPVHEVERILRTIDGYVVIANLNSKSQAVIGGASLAVEQAMRLFTNSGYNAVRLPVSHAFHTAIVAPASEPLRSVLERLDLRPPEIPVVANVTGDFYPMGPAVRPKLLELLGQQVASPVQFVRGLETLYGAGARVFVEVGPKRALQGFVDDVFADRPDVVSLFTNHPKTDDVVAVNQALCGLYAAGIGVGEVSSPSATASTSEASLPSERSAFRAAPPVSAAPAPVGAVPPDRYSELGRLFADFVERSARLLVDRGTAPREPVVITGAALGLPGNAAMFDDRNPSRILHGEQMIDVIPTRFRNAMLDKHITRLVKSEESGAAFQEIDSSADVIKLAARAGHFDLGAEFGISEERIAALDIDTKLAIAVGIDALRDAGIPLVLHYRKTHKGTFLPDRWGLADSLRDDVGVVFASAFPGYDAFAHDLSKHHADRSLRDRIQLLAELQARLPSGASADGELGTEIVRRMDELKAELAATGYAFDRRFLFRILSMGHSQLAELIGARGPNTQVNAACASTTQAVAVAEDWIHSGRCRRVLIVAADDVTSDELLEWMGAGFLASGAAATDDDVSQAALPFDRRRHGMILGMGAAALVVESADAARERGLAPICQVLATVTANSAFHGTRLDVEHICQVMENLVSAGEARTGIERRAMAEKLLFVSHETYTPARGGSASAEVHALRTTFGDAADRIVVANTKGFTGHPMGAGIEDVVAVKALETGLVPPVANFRDVDPELGPLNLSKGGSYPIEYALRLGAGFGSQISMALLRWVAPPDGRRRAPDALGYVHRIADPAAWKAWLGGISGQSAAELEVDHRTLRVKDRGPGAQLSPPAPPVARSEAEVLPAAPAAPPPTSQAEPEPPAASLAAVEAMARPSDAVRTKVLEIVAAKTGYPVEMLDMDLDLEADLGIDTVKQAETFAAVRQAYDIQRDEKLKLRDFPTLAHVVAFVYDRRADLKASAPRAEPAPAEPAAPSKAAVATAAASAPAGASSDPVRAKVLEIVAAKTGYPAEMLDMDLDLEADLGIDTVKQAETFAAVRQAYDIPRDEKLKLRDFPTLAHVVGFVYDRRADLKAPSDGAPPEATTAPRPETVAPAVRTEAESAGDLEAAETVSRRIPVAVLRPPLALCKPTGVTLGKQSRVVVMADRAGVAKALVKRLEKLGVTTLVLDGMGTGEDFDARIAAFQADGLAQGIYWLPAVDAEPDLEQLDLAAWRDGLRIRVKLLHRAMRALYESLAAPGSFLVAATRLGGSHGYDESGASAPMGGAVTGFVKTLKRERSAALVKAVDFEVGRKATEIASLLIDETLRDPGAVEIGYRVADRRGVALLERSARDGRPGMSLGRDTVFLITGAAGGIVAEIVADLAAASSGGTFHLLDLTPAPDPDNPDLARLASDREGLKRELFERRKKKGERITPVMIEREIAALERSLCASRAIEAVRGAGGQAHYHTLDLRDPEAVGAVLDRVREQSGRIDVLVHAAGLEVSHFLPDKDEQEFERIFDIKADGWFNVLRAAHGMPLGATVAFSSIAGRFGNAGQADYAAANDLLCKSTSSLRRLLPETRAIAIDWTAWSGIGMASRGSIPKMMELAGIDMLAPEIGVAVVRRELTAGGGRGEVVIAGKLGVLEEPWDPEGGLDGTRIELASRAPLLGRVLGMDEREGLVVETELDPTVQPFLDHHRIDGTSVLPGVMGLEAFASLATLLLPEHRVTAVEQVRFAAPFKFYRDKPRTLRLSALLRPDGDAIVAECALRGLRTLPGQAEPQITTHFTGRVRLERNASTLGRIDFSAPAAPPPVGVEEIYRIYFHGPAYRVLDGVWNAPDQSIGRMATDLPDDRVPMDAPTWMAPRLIELCFQTAGIREMSATGRFALPERIGAVRVLGDAHGAVGPFYAVVVPGADASFDARVVDAAGNVHVQLEGYTTIALPVGAEADALAPPQAAVS